MHIFVVPLQRKDMALLTAATRPAVGGGPSASDSGDCGIEDGCGISLEVKTWSATGHPQHLLSISSTYHHSILNILFDWVIDDIILAMA